jgi:hypothetical protein
VRNDDTNNNNKNNIIDPSDLLWLLQQSKQIRDFVQTETANIMRDRQEKNKKFLSQQTISSAMWKSLCGVFECIVVSNKKMEKRQQSLSSSVSKVNCTGQLVKMCADLLNRKSESTTSSQQAIVGNVVVPFCLRNAMRFDQEKEEDSKHHNNRSSSLPSSFKRQEMILNVCHIENDETRMKLFSMIAKKDDEKKFEQLARAEGIVK